MPRRKQSPLKQGRQVSSIVESNREHGTATADAERNAWATLRAGDDNPSEEETLSQSESETIRPQGNSKPQRTRKASPKTQRMSSLSKAAQRATSSKRRSKTTKSTTRGKAKSSISRSSRATTRKNKTTKASKTAASKTVVRKNTKKGTKRVSVAKSTVKPRTKTAARRNSSSSRLSKSK